ncbi:hypothetical protein KFK09_013241 [Dendrobium nobile]|uniref:Uncharacterized protein n=1 Tax=Dendrobium nobile TaxID=94219 RepID=A0A8T3B6T3_DENNO|nr:hypothetical protein KFK09_013241 [Dendrobium nobile]
MTFLRNRYSPMYRTQSTTNLTSALACTEFEIVVLSPKYKTLCDFIQISFTLIDSSCLAYIKIVNSISYRKFQWAFSSPIIYFLSPAVLSSQKSTKHVIVLPWGWRFQLLISFFFFAIFGEFNRKLSQLYFRPQAQYFVVGAKALNH